jgi:hypothetical protein
MALLSLMIQSRLQIRMQTLELGSIAAMDTFAVSSDHHISDPEPINDNSLRTL